MVMKPITQILKSFSGFFATDLDLLLKGLNISTLILTGVATDVCVRATTQDVQQLNYKVIVPEECVAGTFERQHKAALENIAYIIGKTMPLKEVTIILSS